MSEAVRTPEEVIHYRSSYVLKGKYIHTAIEYRVPADRNTTPEMLLRGFTTVRDTGAAFLRL